MDEQAFQAKFTELLDKIKDLPDTQRKGLQELAEEARDRRARVQEGVAELQGALDHLRLSVKYLVFDLEATRRENAYLRRLVEQSNQDSGNQNNDKYFDEGQNGAD